MGRSIASASQLVLKAIAGMKILYGALRRSDQLILDGFYRSAGQHSAALANSASPLPGQVFLLLMEMEESKKRAQTLDELRQALRELRAEVEGLKEG